jgi:G3E family GTPase
VTVLTGFLGSGKTTLLRRLLGAEHMDRTAVVINEFGEIGLDHLLVRSVTDNALVLQNGCICCTIRSDIRTSFRELIDGRASGEIPPFDRIVVETTGLADPVPIVQTLVGDPMLKHQTRMANVVTTIDAVLGLGQLGEHPESLRQAAIADCLVLTKADIAEPQAADLLRSKLASLNPTAQILESEQVSVSDVVREDAFDPQSKSDEVRRWLAALPIPAHGPNHANSDQAQFGHDHEISSFVLGTERPIDWTVFGVWLSALVHRHGRRVLRIKGLLNVPDADGPVVLNTVQNIVHRPFHLDDWPDDDHSTRIVFIVQGLDRDTIRRSLDLFLDAA